MDSLYSLEEAGGRWRYRDAADKVEAAIPDGLEPAGLLRVSEPEASDVDGVLAGAIAKPLASPPLRELARGRKDAAIIVSDSTRAVSTARALPFVVDELRQAGLSFADIFLVVAIGVHRRASREEMREILGGLDGKLRILNHDPHDPGQLTEIGVSSRGNRIEVNRRVAGAALRLAIGKVETHEFAGYSGGRKSVLPGIASEKTILFNHRPEMISDPRAVPGRLAGNPVHEDMLEAARLLGLDFCLNIVQNARGRPIAAFAGGLEESHAAAVRYYDQRYGVKVPRGTNIFLTTPGHPLDIDLYQSMKPLFGLYPVLREGDAVVLYSRCREGVNSDDMLEPFGHGPGLAGIGEFLRQNYRIQMDHALLFCKLLQKGIRVFAVSDGVGAEIFARMLMTPAKSIPEALELARDLKLADGETPRLGIAPMAQRLILTPE
ncbi:MAG: nickel-dependent lactate racemase [Planctomycetota bacterium]|jgi:nickel-dependent lactate racemase|nr:nickel-dependent lactate racemase [Planctomycetota bacterium]